MKYVVVRIIEHWSSLEEYFLRFIPKQKEFKRFIKGTKRYENIVECLRNNMVQPYLSFTALICESFNSYVN